MAGGRGRHRHLASGVFACAELGRSAADGAVGEISNCACPPRSHPFTAAPLPPIPGGRRAIGRSETLAGAWGRQGLPGSRRRGLLGATTPPAPARGSQVAWPLKTFSSAPGLTAPGARPAGPRGRRAGKARGWRRCAWRRPHRRLFASGTVRRCHRHACSSVALTASALIEEGKGHMAASMNSWSLLAHFGPPLSPRRSELMMLKSKTDIEVEGAR